MAVDEIVNEMICLEENKPVRIILDDLEQPDNVKKAIEQGFQETLQLLNFKNSAYDIMRRWYIDGRLYFHAIIDENKTADGIKELRYIDPRKIRKVREIERKKVKGGSPGVDSVITGDATLQITKNEYYIYSEKGFSIGNRQNQGPATTGLRIAKDAIVQSTSGLTDSTGSMVLGFLHKAIKPLNQLRTLEDASVIYRLARAPERRVWYIDVGNLPKMKAEQYVRDIMVKHKNKLVYDANSGEIRDDRKFMTMLEDYWLPRRDGKGTEVDTLPPGTSFDQISDILYFQKKFYNSLNVPVNRLSPDDKFSNDIIATGITREEIKFGKFIARMRNRFSLLFTKVLEKQLVLKHIMTIEDFQRISKFFRYDYAKDSYFVELKDAQILNGRVELAHAMIDLVGRYYSNTWLRKNVLKQTDEDIEENDDQIAEESMNPQYNMAGEMGPSAGGILGDMALGGESGGPGSDKGGTAPGGQSPESGVKKATPGSPGKSNPKLKSLKNISQKLAS
jgi:hypothetical protein